MNEQDKLLLLKVLCVMLPHGVIMHNLLKDYDVPLKGVENDNKSIRISVGGEFSTHSGCLIGFWKGANFKWEWKPYLRPMTSMTDMEKQQFNLLSMNRIVPDGFGKDIQMFSLKCIDWLNSHYFDYYGLIEKGLALPAPEGMYDI